MSVEQRSFDGEHEESYYKLRPVGNGNSTYYVPVERAADRLRPLLTKEQIYGLIDEMADVDFSETEWCSNSRERRGIFQNILHSDDYKEMMQMMHTLYQQQERKRRSGHRLAAADEAAMHAAENRMYQEFGIVLDIQPEQVHSLLGNGWCRFFHKVIIKNSYRWKKVLIMQIAHGKNLFRYSVIGSVSFTCVSVRPSRW